MKCIDNNIGFNICEKAGIPSNQNGENNSRAVINEEIAIHIKQDLANGMIIKEVQENYSVSYQLVVNIRNLLAWKECVPELNDNIKSNIKQRKPKSKIHFCHKCGKEITEKQKNYTYCNDCKSNIKYGKCLICGIEIENYNNRRKYCSECADTIHFNQKKEWDRQNRIKNLKI